MAFWKRTKKPNDSNAEKQLLAQDNASSTQARSSGSNFSKDTRRHSKGVVILGIPPLPYTSRPHVTDYNPGLVMLGLHTICRCMLPAVHGDAFTRRHHAEAANGITFLDRSCNPISWEHAVDADSQVSAGWHREEALLRKVYHEETMRQIRKYNEVWQSVRRLGKLRCALENDVYWWGEENLKEVVLRNIQRAPAGWECGCVGAPAPVWCASEGLRRLEFGIRSQLKTDCVVKISEEENPSVGVKPGQETLTALSQVRLYC